jgi:competence protein ComGC
MLEIFTTYNIIIGVSVILNIVLLIGVRNLLRQNEQLEDRVVGTVQSVRNRVESALDEMRRLDTREAFEKDDEVGVTFNELKKIVEDLNNQI